MSIGLCCQYLQQQRIKKSGEIVYENISHERTLQYNKFLKGHYKNEEIIDLWTENVDNITLLIKRLIVEGYKSFRLSSNLFPLYDCAQELLINNNLIKTKLQNLGNIVKASNVRLTTHPDQFCVISSNTESIIDKSVKMLAHHAWVFDIMGLAESAYYAINIHGGTRDKLSTLINSIKNLPNNISKRLTLENDERCYNTSDLYKVFEETGVPVVFDSHHYKFNTGGLAEEKAFDLAKSTWAGARPLTHLSNTEPSLANEKAFNKLRQHSQYVHYIPDYQLQDNNNDLIDIDFEFKMKNLAIEKAIKDFKIKK
jgi:UV DNA damage endonuclease